MSTTLDASFLRAVTLMVAFKPERMKRAQATLLYMGLQGGDFTAAELPAEVTEGNKHVAGAATGALVAMQLLAVVGRCKSPDPAAKGRKLDILRLPSDKIGTARAWLSANGFPPSTENCQSEMKLEAAA